jgi:hypothetical protein
MLSPDDMTRTINGIERPSRPTNRRDFLYEKRQNILQQRQTESLPKVNGDSSRTLHRQIAFLRDENRHLQRELEIYKAAQAEFDKEIEIIRSSDQQELEQFQEQMHEMMEERNQMQESFKQLEQRYQELYHSYQDAVEEEANKMVAEAARTLILSPEHTPALLRDVVKTLEYQLRQQEDQHVAEALYYLRETQHKAEQLEQLLEQERNQYAAERQNFLNMIVSVRSQAELRSEVLQSHLRARWTTALTLMTSILLLLLPILQIIFLFYFKQSLMISFVGPLAICIVLGFIFARFRSTANYYHASVPHKHKVPAKKAPGV